MASVEIFCSNVKMVLAQRSVRIKDLAEQIGLSESYLSLVLNGTRKNLNDEYKDRIASYLNLTLSQLYSEDFVTAAPESSAPVFVEDPDRKETVRLIENFLIATSLTPVRSSFHAALANMNDRDSRTVRSFFRFVLSDLARSEEPESVASANAVPLTDLERTLLAVFSLAKDGARYEWVLSASGLDQAEFDKTAELLIKKGVLRLSDEGGSRRAGVLGRTSTPSSLFTLVRLRDIHLSLAYAMLAYPDEGPFFKQAVADNFLKAGRNKEAIVHLKEAADLMETTGLWREAAEIWHRASIICGIVNDAGGRSNCLAEAAKCLGAAGEFDEANEFGSYACRVIQQMGLPRAVGDVCIMMGNVLRGYDLGAAIEWYKRGLKSSQLEDEGRGGLLINLAAALLEAGKLDESENALRETRRWLSSRDEPGLVSIRIKVSLSLGVIEYQRRNWKKATNHFEACLSQDDGNNQALLGVAWHNLGMLAYRDDNMKTAKEYLLKAQPLYWHRKDKVSWAYAAIELGKVALREGNLEEAMHQVLSAEPYLEEKSVIAKGWSNLIKACIDRAQRRQSQAIENGRRAMETFQRENAERELSVAALWLADLYREAGDSQQAAFVERRAFQIYEKRHWDVRELHRERSLLESKAE